MSKTNFQFLVSRQSSNCLCHSRCHSWPSKHNVFPLGRLSQRDFYLLLTADMILTIFIFIVDSGSRFLCMLARTNKHFTERRASQTTSDRPIFHPLDRFHAAHQATKGALRASLKLAQISTDTEETIRNNRNDDNFFPSRVLPPVASPSVARLMMSRGGKTEETAEDLANRHNDNLGMKILINCVHITQTTFE